MNVPARSKLVRLPELRIDLLDHQLRKNVPLSVPIVSDGILDLGPAGVPLSTDTTISVLFGDATDAYVSVIEGMGDSPPSFFPMLWRAAQPVVNRFLLDERGAVTPSNWRWSVVGERIRELKRYASLLVDIRRSASNGPEAMVIVHRTEVRPEHFDATHLDWLIEAALQREGLPLLEKAIHNLYAGNSRIFGRQHLKGLAQLMKRRSNGDLTIAYVLRDMAVRIDGLSVAIISEMSDFASDSTNMGASNVAYLMMSIAELRPTWQAIIAHAIVRAVAGNDAIGPVLKFSTHIFPESQKILISKLLQQSEFAHVRDVLAHIIQIHPDWVDLSHYSELAGLASRHKGVIAEAYAYLIEQRDSPRP